MNKIFNALLFTGLTGLLFGCGSYPAFVPCENRTQSAECYKPTSAPVDLIAINTQAVNQLFAQANLNTNAILWVTPLADIKQMESSSAFGRLLAEHIQTASSRRHQAILALTLTEPVNVQTEGAVVLSPAAQRLAQQAQIDALIVGTYAVAQQTVYVNLQLLTATHNRVLAATSYSVPRTADINVLLERNY